jgi:ABC-type nitrate/sulfonate/bicarbonate transport system permease component
VADASGAGSPAQAGAARVAEAVVGRRSSKPSEETRAERAAKLNDIAIRVAFVVFLICLWHGAHYVLVTSTEKWSGALFPSPRQVVVWLWDGFGLSYFTGTYQKVPGQPAPGSFVEAFLQKDYARAIGASLYRLVVGYLIAVAIGFPLGLLVARFSLARKPLAG